MPPPAKAVADLGSVAQNGAGWRARVQLKRRNVDGPTRATHAEAQADLDRARQCASRSELKHVLGRVKVMKVRGASQTAFQKVRMKIRGAAQPAAKAKAKVKQCSKPRCRNNAASPRAKFCIGCFKDNARCTGARTGGNSGAKGVIGNSGNSSAKGVIGNRGNSSAKGVKGNSGNSSAKGLMGNRGNTNSGKKKKFAGKRCALLRSTKTLLLVMKPWVELILAGKKVWEIRGVCTKLRGKIHRTIVFRFKS